MSTFLNLSGNNCIRDLQFEFSNAYPFLKIEFLQDQNIRRPGHKKYLDASLPLSAAGLTMAGTMQINDSMTVDQLENRLKNNFGLKALAFRKLGPTWLEISMTGGWTLKQQNQHGQELADIV